MLINRTGSMLIAFMSLYLTKELNYSLPEAGIVMAAYGGGSILGSYLGGWICDKKGYYEVIIYSLIISGLLLIPLLWVTNFYLITIIVFTYALIADSFRPANSVAVANFSTPHNRTRSITLMRLAINLGFTIGPAMGGLIAAYWVFKYVFLIDAITSILAAMLLLYYLPKKEVKKSQEVNEVPAPRSLTAFRDKDYMVFLFLVSLYGIFFFQLFASVPVYFDRNFNYSEDTIGYLLALNGLIVFLIEMPMIYELEKIKQKHLFIPIGCLMMTLAYLLISIGNSAIILSIIYTVFITMSEIFAMPFMMNYAMNRPNKDRQGQYIALYSAAYGLSHIVAPSLGLMFSDRFGFQNFYVFAAVASVMLAYLFFNTQKQKLPVQS